MRTSEPFNTVKIDPSTNLIRLRTLNPIDGADMIEIDFPYYPPVSNNGYSEYHTSATFTEGSDSRFLQLFVKFKTIPEQECEADMSGELTTIGGAISVNGSYSDACGWEKPLPL